MTRPAPIIIPGQFGMGGSMQSSESETDILGSLLKLGQLYKVYQDTIGAQKARSESAPALAQFMGLDKSTPDQPGAVTGSPEQGGFVNAPTSQPGRPGMSPEQIQNLSKSGILPEMVLQQVKNQGQMTSDKAIAQMFRMGNVPGAKELAGIKAPVKAGAGPHETEVMGSSVPDALRPDNFDPSKTWRVMRDPQGTITKVVGEGKPSYAGVAGSTRGMQAFDLQSGKMVPVSWNEQNSNPGRYLGTQDANVRALADQEKYSVGISRFTNRLDTLGKTITDTLEKSGLNKGNKFQNYVVQDLIQNKVLGEGDVIGLKNLINGYGTELGKVESGSIGISGATVEAMKRFEIPANLPVAELIKTLDIGKSAGQSVTDAMAKTRKSAYEKIYAGTDYEIPKGIGVSAEKAPAAQAGAKPKTWEELKKQKGY